MELNDFQAHLASSISSTGGRFTNRRIFRHIHELILGEAGYVVSQTPEFLEQINGEIRTAINDGRLK
jgi:hypothetical protein